MSFQNSENSTSTSSEDVVRATESLLACHLQLSTGSPLNAPYSFCDKDLPADRGLLYHTFHISSFYREGWISAAFSVLPSRDGWGREWHIIYVCDVNSKFNLCVVTKHRKWEIRVGNVTFFVLCLVVTLVFAIKINRNTYWLYLHWSCITDRLSR